MGVGSLISDNLFQKENEGARRIIGCFLLSLWLLIGVFILYKTCCCFSLPKKIKELSQKTAQIDKEIANELSKL